MPRYTVERVLPYSAEGLFDLVADVERYPGFVPWWVAARVSNRSTRTYRTDQVLRIGLIRARFSSTTTLHRPHRIDVTSTDRPFRAFHLVWRFEPIGGERCRVVLDAELELRSRMLAGLVERVLSGFPEAIVDAFERRARRLCELGSRPKPRTVDED